MSLRVFDPNAAKVEAPAKATQATETPSKPTISGIKDELEDVLASSFDPPITSFRTMISEGKVKFGLEHNETSEGGKIIIEFPPAVSGSTRKFVLEEGNKMAAKKFPGYTFLAKGTI